MFAFNCLISFGLLVHLVSSDVSLTIGSNKQNVRTDQTVRSNYEAPRGYDYSGSYSTVAPENKAQYVGSYSSAAPDSKAQYVGSYSSAAPETKAQYVGSYSTVAPDSKAQYVGSYSSAAPDTKAQYVGSYSNVAPDNKAQYVGSYSSENKAQYTSSYSSGAPDTKAQYVGSYSTVAPDNKAQYVGSYSSGNKAQYTGSYSSNAPENKAQYVTPSQSTSYDSYPSGQISSDRKYSAKQEYSPQYQNDRGVLLISKELQVPFVSSKDSDDSNDCDKTNESKVNQQGEFDQNTQKEQVEQNVEENVERNVESNVGQNVEQNVEQNSQSVENDETVKPVYKTSRYEVRRPGIRKEFYDIEEKVLIKPAGSAIFELQHDKPHSSAIVNKHISRQQAQYPQYPQYSDDDAQYYPQDQQYANHGYNPVIIQSVPSTGYDYNPVVHQSPPRPHVTYPNTYNPVYPSTTVTPAYVPPVAGGYPSGGYPSGGYPSGGYLPPCEETPPSKPQHEFSDEREEDEHDYDSDAAFITPSKEENQDFVDVVYAPSKSNSNRDREDYKVPQSAVYNPESRIDRVRLEYQNQRGDLAQQKVSQYQAQQFHQEYVPTLNVNEKQVQIRPNGAAPSAKYSQENGNSQVEIQNSQRLLDLYSANGDVTEIGFGSNVKSQQYKAPSGNVRARVVSVTPAPEYSNYVDEQTKSRRVVLSKPLYTVQQVEVREHNHRLVEDVQSESSVEPKVSEFEKLRLIGNSSGSEKSYAQRQAEINKDFEYVTPVPQEYGHLRAGAPVPENLQK